MKRVRTSKDTWHCIWKYKATIHFSFEGHLGLCRISVTELYLWLDRCANGGGILLYVRGDISSCLLTEHKLQNNTECLFIEINIRKKKWLFCCSYNPNKNNISKHLHCLTKCLNKYISQYDKIMLLGDLNVESSDTVLNDFVMFTIYLALLKNQHVSKTLIIHHV